MARGYAVDLAEVLEVVHANLVAEEVEESILQHAPVSIEQDEAIPIDLVWILRIEGHNLLKRMWYESHDCVYVTLILMIRQQEFVHRYLVAIKLANNW
jgi:hypothetical protein